MPYIEITVSEHKVCANANVNCHKMPQIHLLKPRCNRLSTRSLGAY
jgi:hypothetical protein